MMSAFNDGFRREWFLHRKMRAADAACYQACGMNLHSAWMCESGCYVTGGSWMSPSGIARAIARVTFDWSDE
jgi:hypothetical protein